MPATIARGQVVDLPGDETDQHSGQQPFPVEPATMLMICGFTSGAEIRAVRPSSAPRAPPEYQTEYRLVHRILHEG